MKLAKGDLWSQIGIVDAICITTNGFVKHNGAAVMGRGCAKQATKRFPEIEHKLGNAITKYGNGIFLLAEERGTKILSFPVKHTSMVCTSPHQMVTHMRNRISIGNTIPGWALIADLELIRKSAQQLIEGIERRGWTNVALPRPGCGAGELSWTQVEPILSSILDNRFTAWSY